MQNANTVRLVNVHINNDERLCATLTDLRVAVQCEGLWYVDFGDGDDMRATFDEWVALAQAGEEGYTFVAGFEA